MALQSFGAGGSAAPPDQTQRPRKRQQAQGQQGQEAQTGQPQAQVAPAPAPTFAQMQANGQARPAPPTPAQAPVSAAGQAVNQQLQSPNPYGSQEVQNSYKLLSQNIDDQYTQAQRATNEQMASRGLYDSTKAVGALSDLNIGQRDAKTQLAQQLLDQQSQSQGQYQNSAIQNALGYEGNQNAYTLGQGQLQLGQGNLALAQQGQNQNYGLAQQQFGLQQQGQQQSYGLAQQSQQLAQQLGLGGLGLQQQQQANQASQFGQSYGLQQQALQQQQQYQTWAQILQALGLSGQLGVDGGDTGAVNAFTQQLMTAMGYPTPSDTGFLAHHPPPSGLSSGRS